MTITLGNGTIIFNDGTVQSSAAQSFGAQNFTSSGTFTVPAGVTLVKLIVVGGGGNGAGGAGAGGGSGGYATGYYTVSPGAQYSVTVGGSQGTSSVSGTGISVSASGGSGQSPGSGSGGQVNVTGQLGQSALGLGSGVNDPGYGGESVFPGFGWGGFGSGEAGGPGWVMFEW